MSTETAKSLSDSLDVEANLESQLRNLQSELAKQKKTSDGFHIKMRETVGRNIQTKVFKVTALKVVIVTYVDEKTTTVKVEQIED